MASFIFLQNIIKLLYIYNNVIIYIIKEIPF